MPKTKRAERGNRVSLVPLTTGQAMAALLKVIPADVKNLEQAEKRKGRKK